MPFVESKTVKDGKTIKERYFMSKKKRKINELEKRIADLEVQVQSQQEIVQSHIEFDMETNNELINLIKQGLDIHANFSK